MNPYVAARDNLAKALQELDDIENRNLEGHFEINKISVTRAQEARLLEIFKETHENGGKVLIGGYKQGFLKITYQEVDVTGAPWVAIQCLEQIYFLFGGSFTEFS